MNGDGWSAYIDQRLAESAAGSVDLSQPSLLVLDRALTELRRFMTPTMPAPAVVPRESDDGHWTLILMWHQDGWDVEVSVGETETQVWISTETCRQGRDGSLDDEIDYLKYVLSELRQCPNAV